MMTKLGTVLVLAAGALQVFTRGAIAQPAQDTVVILTMAECCRDISWSEAEEALVEELNLVDVPVRLVSGKGADEISRLAELEQAAASNGAAAAVRLTKSQDGVQAGVDLWIVDRVTGKTTYRRLDVDRGYDASATIDVAVRVVEALRASFLELRMTGRQETSRKSASPQIVELAETTAVGPDRDLFGLGLGSSVNLSPGGAGVRGAFSLTGIIHPASGLDVEITLLFSPLGQELQTGDDVSTFDYVLVSGGIFYRFLRKAVVQPAIGVAAGSLIAWTKGRTTDGEPLLSDSEAVAYLGGGARLFLFPMEAFDIFVGAHAGITLPEIRAMHGDTLAGRFGRPFAEIVLGVQLRFA